MKNLEEIRLELDAVDTEIVALFEKRMQLCRQVAEYKIANGIPVLDAGREAKVLDSRAAKAQDEALRPAVRDLFVCLMSLSRAEQQQMMEESKSC